MNNTVPMPISAPIATSVSRCTPTKILLAAINIAKTKKAGAILGNETADTLAHTKAIAESSEGNHYEYTEG